MKVVVEIFDDEEFEVTYIKEDASDNGKPEFEWKKENNKDNILYVVKSNAQGRKNVPDDLDVVIGTMDSLKNER